MSLSARRAWIEITSCWRVSGRAFVALRKESVDRNFCHSLNLPSSPMSLSARRAWIEIRRFLASWSAVLTSLSARRAWIEIPAGCWRESRRAVALRKESVDRNIPRGQLPTPEPPVALRKESVDRNLWWGVRKAVGSRRSPQGERG